MICGFPDYLLYVSKSLCVQQHQSVSFFIRVRDTPHPDAFGLWFNSAAESKAWDNHIIKVNDKCDPGPPNQS